MVSRCSVVSLCAPLCVPTAQRLCVFFIARSLLFEFRMQQAPVSPSRFRSAPLPSAAAAPPAPSRSWCAHRPSRSRRTKGTPIRAKKAEGHGGRFHPSEGELREDGCNHCQLVSSVSFMLSNFLLCPSCIALSHHLLYSRTHCRSVMVLNSPSTAWVRDCAMWHLQQLNEMLGSQNVDLEPGWSDLADFYVMTFGGSDRVGEDEDGCRAGLLHQDLQAAQKQGRPSQDQRLSRAVSLLPHRPLHFRLKLPEAPMGSMLKNCATRMVDSGGE